MQAPGRCQRLTGLDDNDLLSYSCFRSTILADCTLSVFTLWPRIFASKSRSLNHFAVAAEAVGIVVRAADRIALKDAESEDWHSVRKTWSRR